LAIFEVMAFPLVAALLCASAAAFRAPAAPAVQTQLGAGFGAKPVDTKSQYVKGSPKVRPL
jgi:hypothetical protein